MQPRDFHGRALTLGYSMELADIMETRRKRLVFTTWEELGQRIFQASSPNTDFIS